MDLRIFNEKTKIDREIGTQGLAIFQQLQRSSELS